MLLPNSSIYPGLSITLWVPLPHPASARNNYTAGSLLMAKERVEQRDHRTVYLGATLWGLEDGALSTVVRPSDCFSLTLSESQEPSIQALDTTWHAHLLSAFPFPNYTTSASLDVFICNTPKKKKKSQLCFETLDSCQHWSGFHSRINL